MGNLIKAEWYRISHTNPSLKIVFLGLLTCALLSFIGGDVPIFRIENVSSMGVMSMYICTMIIASLVGESYSKRVAFYEIMDGKSASTIILSKFVVYTPLAVMCYYIPVSTLLLIFDGREETIKYVVLLFFIFMRIFVFSLCLPMIFKSVEAVALGVGRAMIEVFSIALIQPKDNMAQMLPTTLEWLPIGQITNMSLSITGALVAKVIIGFTIEVMVMYVLAYMSFKKKWMIKTTII